MDNPSGRHLRPTLCHPAGFGVEERNHSISVQLAPPVLKVKYTRNILDVNVSFTYPSCMKDVFQDLTYDLEIWRVGFRNLVTILENNHKPSVEVPATEWPDEEHCLRARTSFFRNGDRKRSNFSEPLCLLLHQEARKWEIIAFPLLAILVIGGVMLFFCYKQMIKQAEMPSVLDFSKYQHPKNLLEFDEENLTISDLFILGQKNTPAHLLTLSAHSLFEEGEDSDEDDEEDNSSLIPYTETLRFQKKDENCSTVEMFPKCSDSSFGSGDSQLSGEGWPPATTSEPFFTAEWMTMEASSGVFEKTFLSEESVMNESVSLAGDFSAASQEGEEVTNRDIDFLNKLMFLESHGLDFPADLKIRTAGVQCRSIFASLQNSKTSLCSEPEGQQVTEEKGGENESNNCEDLQLEKPLLDVSCKDRVENGEGVENNTVKSTRHNYQPRPVVLNLFNATTPNRS
ncbi:interferon lambda receptor 1 isoform X2 [Crotalus tigris]|uniref:interferon lambda receptor 1 isoform X2 n=1 Tax=Crotalus tigris TaxID=88082 RepID=UPI00192F43E9|nr:interferon lambda receptor 1 isoform X2 [Crotalus tigris]